MEKMSASTSKSLKALGVVLCLGALPLVGGLNGCAGD